MIQANVTVKSTLEPIIAFLLVQNATKFTSNIKICIGDKVANAKSIMSIISLTILDGQEITVTAEGDDEVRAVNDLVNFLQKN